MGNRDWDLGIGELQISQFYFYNKKYYFNKNIHYQKSFLKNSIQKIAHSL
jgi:hypothetical protein